MAVNGENNILEAMRGRKKYAGENKYFSFTEQYLTM